MSEPQSDVVDNPMAYLDERESVGAWFTRMLKGIMVGIGFILPGLSGGVLAVIFRIYDPIIRFLSKPLHRFVSQVRYFVPIGVGAIAGIVLFSVVVDAAFGRFAPQFICLFIGFVIGTFPSLFRQAGKKGRGPRHWAIMAIGAAAIFVIMLLGGSALLEVPPSIPVWFGSGALIGLGVVVPGLSPSNFLIYFGLYGPMSDNLKVLDPATVIPLGLGGVVCVLLFARLAAWAFDTYYAQMYHLILGTVVGSSLAIFPAVVFPAFTEAGLAESGLSLAGAIVFALVLLVAGTVASLYFSRFEARYEAQREAADAAAKSGAKAGEAEGGAGTTP